MNETTQTQIDVITKKRDELNEAGAPAGVINALDYWVSDITRKDYFSNQTLYECPVCTGTLFDTVKTHQNYDETPMTVLREIVCKGCGQTKMMKFLR